MAAQQKLHKKSLALLLMLMLWFLVDVDAAIEAKAFCLMAKHAAGQNPAIVIQHRFCCCCWCRLIIPIQRNLPCFLLCLLLLTLLLLVLLLLPAVAAVAILVTDRALLAPEYMIDAVTLAAANRERKRVREGQIGRDTETATESAILRTYTSCRIVPLQNMYFALHLSWHIFQ